VGHHRCADLRRVGTRAVQVGAAVAVDRAHVGHGQRLDPLLAALGVVEVVVEQSAPPAADAHHVDPGVDGAVDDGFDTGVEAGDVTSPGEDADTHSDYSR